MFQLFYSGSNKLLHIGHPTVYSNKSHSAFFLALVLVLVAAIRAEDAARTNKVLELLEPISRFRPDAHEFGLRVALEPPVLLRVLTSPYRLPIEPCWEAEARLPSRSMSETLNKRFSADEHDPGLRHFFDEPRRAFLTDLVSLSFVPLHLRDVNLLRGLSVGTV